MAMAFPLKRTKLTLQDIRTAQALDYTPIHELSFDEFCIVEHVIYNATYNTSVPTPEAIHKKIAQINDRRSTFETCWLLACLQLDFPLTGLLPVGYLKPQ